MRQAHTHPPFGRMRGFTVTGSPGPDVAAVDHNGTGTREHSDEQSSPIRWSKQLRDLGNDAEAKWDRRFTADLAAQVALMTIAVAGGVLAVGYALVHGTEMVNGALDSRPDGQSFVERLISLTWPVVVLATLAIIAGAGAWMAHLRSVEAWNCNFQALTQYWRDTSVPVQSRELEEQVNFARSAFQMLMWLARALFIVSLGLFAAVVVDIIVRGKVDASAIVLGAGSLAGALYGTARHVQNNVTSHLADVLQIQTALNGCSRELALLERMAKRREEYPEVSSVDIVRAMDTVVGNAVERIESYADRIASEGDAQDQPSNEGDTPEDNAGNTGDTDPG